jgi:manganese-dependent inorganic pyrophosphatase
MFERSSDVARVSAADLVTRDLKDYELDGNRTLSVAQIESVGGAVKERAAELLAAAEEHREHSGHVLFALMLTDILARDTLLLVTGNESIAERAFGATAVDGRIELPGVMSRKKQVAPGLMAAATGG